MANEYARNQRDASFATTKALPAAAAAHNTSSFDLDQIEGGQIEGVEAEIVIPALTALVEAKTVTIKLQDSADDSSFADVDPLVQTSVVGATGNGCAAKTVRFRFPPGTRRYVALNIAVAASGGDSTAKSIEFNLLF